MITIVDSADEKAVRNLGNALKFYEGMIDAKDAAATVERHVAPEYVQHNPTLPDGAAGLAAAFTTLGQARSAPRVVVHRIIASGDYVFSHVNFLGLYSDDPDDLGIAGVDILRFNDEGLAVEHWDALQPVVHPDAAANPNGMFASTDTDRRRSGN